MSITRSSATPDQVLAAARRYDPGLETWGCPDRAPSSTTCRCATDAPPDPCPRRCECCWCYWCASDRPDECMDHAAIIHGVRFDRELFPLPLVRSFDLLETVLNHRQRGELWGCGYTVETLRHARMLIELSTGVFRELRPRDGHLHGVGWCIDPEPDDELGPLDRIVSKLVWLRGDTDDFFATANEFDLFDVTFERALDRCEDTAPQRRAWHRWLQSGSELRNSIGEEATLELHRGMAIWHAGELTVVFGQSPVYLLTEDWAVYELPVRDARPGETRLELWAEVISRLSELVGTQISVALQDMRPQKDFELN